MTRLAGSLYVARQRGPVDPYRFIVYDNGSSATLYYEDIQLLTVYNQDAYAAGFGDAGSYANGCAQLLREWAPVANANDAAKADKDKD